MLVRPLVSRLSALYLTILLSAVRRPKLDAALLTRESRNLLKCAHSCSPSRPVGTISDSQLQIRHFANCALSF